MILEQLDVQKKWTSLPFSHHIQKKKKLEINHRPKCTKLKTVKLREENTEEQSLWVCFRQRFLRTQKAQTIKEKKIGRLDFIKFKIFALENLLLREWKTSHRPEKILAKYISW